MFVVTITNGAENTIIHSDGTDRISGGKASFFLDTNNHSVSVYDENEKRQIYLEGNTGTVYAKNFQQTN